jgi:hypothetical protein
MGRGVVVSSMQKTVKTGMSPGDEKSYLAEYGELWSLWGGLIHVLAWSRLALDFFWGFVLVCSGLERRKIVFRRAATNTVPRDMYSWFMQAIGSSRSRATNLHTYPRRFHEEDSSSVQ